MQKFLSQAEISSILYDLDSLINDKEALNYFSMHYTLKGVLKVIIDTTLLDNQFYCQKVTELTNNILITEENLLKVLKYLSGNITSKVLSIDSDEISNEELRLFTDQADLIVQILRSNKVPQDYVVQLQNQFSSNLETYT